MNTLNREFLRNYKPNNGISFVSSNAKGDLLIFTDYQRNDACYFCPVGAITWALDPQMSPLVFDYYDQTPFAHEFVREVKQIEHDLLQADVEFRILPSEAKSRLLCLVDKYYPE